MQFPDVTQGFDLREIIFRREHVESVLERMENPDLCAFSVYIWNNQYCLALAKAIKARWPSCMIVFGGPQVSSSYTRYEFIDSMVLNEGERCFVKILETMNQNQPLELFYKMPRIDDLVEVPSPYSSGVFDDIVAKNPDLCWSASLETNRGCPYSCTFCDWGGLTVSKVKKFSLDRVINDIDWLTRVRTKTIFITDANFGIFKERDLEIAKIIGGFIKKRPGIEYISLNYTKMSNENVFAIARELGKPNKGITFSVQSMNPDVLQEIKRNNMAVNDISHLISLSKKYNIHNYTELILGLPKETLESWKDGMSQLLDIGQHNRIEIIPGMVLENTEMHDIQVKKFNMTLVEAKEIITYSDPNESPIVECAPMITGTSTMSTEDMIEAFMFGWTLTHWHTYNYSRVLTMFCRHTLGVSYRRFYEKLQALVSTDPGPIGKKYRQQRQALANIYKHGESKDPEIRLDNLQFQAIKFFYENLEGVVNMAIDVANSFGYIDPGVVEIQKRTLDNSTWTVPTEISTNTDLETWKTMPCVYKVESQCLQIPKTNEEFFVRARRNRILDTLISKMNNKEITEEKEILDESK
jgi:hypothetical protein